MRKENQWEQFETLKLDYYYKKFQSEIVENFRQKKKQDLENYKDKTSDYPRAIKEKDLNKLADDNRIFLKNSHQLWMETQKVSDLIKPILFYYSWQQFAAFFIYSLLKWPNPPMGHGVQYGSGKDPDNLQEVTIELREAGFFKRLVDSFVILGYPTAYGSWIPLRAHTYRKNEIETKIPTGKNKFVEILDFDSKIFATSLNEQFPNNSYVRHVDVLLTDFLIVFVASNIARYRPKLWINVLEGIGEDEAKFKLKVEKAYNDFNIDLISFLNEVKNQLWKWKSGTTPFYPPKD